MLTRLALRLATVRALRGRTLVGAHVYDSEIAPIDEIAAERPRPFIVVYTDDASFRHGDRDLFATAGDNRVGSGFQKLVIEIGVTQRMRILDDEGAPREDAVQPQTDPALEVNIDLIERQVLAALMSPVSAWAEIWRGFIREVGDHESQRGTSMRDGVRFAGRQITLSVRLLKESPPGAPRGPVWSQFLTLASGEIELAPLVPIIEAALDDGALEPWQVTQAAYGLTEAESRALQIVPPAGTEDVSPDFAHSPAGQPDAQTL